jgi:osmotically-inducible protein OsmY
MAKCAAAHVVAASKHTGDVMESARAMDRLLASSLHEHVESALHAAGYGALRLIQIIVRGRLVTLRGRVPSYYLKQIALATARAVPGVHEVCNEWMSADLVRPFGKKGDCPDCPLVLGGLSPFFPNALS